MDHVDFMHLLRLSEQACESDAKGYRRSVWWFAVLGYAVVLVLALAAVGLLAAVIWAAVSGRSGGWMLWPAPVALALLWVTARALVTRFPPPEGFRITPADAPALFNAIERLRSAVKGPLLDEVLLDASFNAAILQRPRLGWLVHTNHLIIGWPLMCALEPRRLLAVIAHEYGHLRGEHGKFSAWIYRTRSAWWRLQRSYETDKGPVPWLVRGFLAWYGMCHASMHALLRWPARTNSRPTAWPPGCAVPRWWRKPGWKSRSSPGGTTRSTGPANGSAP